VFTGGPSSDPGADDRNLRRFGFRFGEPVELPVAEGAHASCSPPGNFTITYFPSVRTSSPRAAATVESRPRVGTLISPVRSATATSRSVRASVTITPYSLFSPGTQIFGLDMASPLVNRRTPSSAMRSR
jgi:hypothetical protein